MNKEQLTNTVSLLRDVQKITLGPDWHKADNDYAFAALVEVGEMAQEIQWEWWKKKKVNPKNLEVELVDILHFIYAGALKGFIDRGATEEEAIEKIVKEFDGLPSFSNIRSPNPLLAYVKLFACRLTFDVVDFPLFKLICNETLEGGLASLYPVFLRKAALNMFRQLNGYKTGDYSKIWGLDAATAKEDNYYVERLPIHDDTTPAKLLEQMAILYAQHTTKVGLYE